MTHFGTEHELTRLTAEWYELISGDHHKDRDCHFTISKVWSYGKQPVYRIEHRGYLCSELPQTRREYESYQSARSDLIIMLRGMIEYWSRVKEQDEQEGGMP